MPGIQFLSFSSWRRGFISTAAAIIILAAFLTIGYAPPAEALPSYARQTGQPCGTCHTDFAGLTPYGRLFKIQGYTAGGGPYRTTLFPGSDNYRNSYIPPIMVKSATSSDNIDRGDQKTWVPPISTMAIIGFTNTQTPLLHRQRHHTTPTTILCSSPVSFFWGGAITENIGAFAQVTYSAPAHREDLARIHSARIPGLGTTLISAMRTQPRLPAASMLRMASRRTITQPSRTLEYDAGLGVPIRGIDLGTTDLDPAHSSMAPLRCR